MQDLLIFRSARISAGKEDDLAAVLQAAGKNHRGYRQQRNHCQHEWTLAHEGAGRSQAAGDLGEETTGPGSRLIL